MSDDSKARVHERLVQPARVTSSDLTTLGEVTNALPERQTRGRFVWSRRRLVAPAAGIGAVALMGTAILAVVGLPGSTPGPHPTFARTLSPSADVDQHVIDRATAFFDVTWSPDGSDFAGLAQTQTSAAEVRIYSSGGALVTTESGRLFVWLDATRVAVLQGKRGEVSARPVVLVDVRQGMRTTLPGTWDDVSSNGKGVLTLGRVPGNGQFVLWTQARGASAQIEGWPAAWSPDGGRLAYWLPQFTNERGPGSRSMMLASTGSPSAAVLSILDAASTEQLVSYARNPLDSRIPVSWSPDGAWLAGVAATAPLGPLLLPAPGPAVGRAPQSFRADFRSLGWTANGRLLVARGMAVATWDPSSRVLVSGLPAGAHSVWNPCGGSLALDASGALLAETFIDSAGYVYLAAWVVPGYLSPDRRALACGRPGTADKSELVLSTVAALAPAPDPPALPPAEATFSPVP